MLGTKHEKYARKHPLGRLERCIALVLLLCRQLHIDVGRLPLLLESLLSVVQPLQRVGIPAAGGGSKWVSGRAVGTMRMGGGQRMVKQTYKNRRDAGGEPLWAAR